MLHLRLLVPAELTGAVADLLEAERGVASVVVAPGVGRGDVDDMVLADVAREAANGVLGRLCDLGVPERGSISVEDVDTVLSRAADRAEHEAPGHGQDAVVWEQVEDATSEESSLSWTYLAFLTIATLIAGVGVLTDQPILVVGAMVVGPEFGPLAGLCVAIVQRRVDVMRRSLRALLVGFPVAIGLCVLLTLAARAGGLVTVHMLDRTRPLTDFISHPDGLSFVVAVLAGAAGVLSLTSAKSSALIGVTISVTTVPAAGNAAVALALGDPAGAGGSALQLSINLAGIIVAGTSTLLVQKWAWRHTGTESGRYS